MKEGKKSKLIILLIHNELPAIVFTGGCLEMKISLQQNITHLFFVHLGTPNITYKQEEQTFAN